ncbi:tRNA uracil 4-sulfurtransferase ThiI [Bacillus horti]|uniref:Probable tRNA sulfurtransferase n=1 Tax=Caldalkalibacillus horti TaxID=77523 RepID=A0ABT9W4D4_9BACI|nr:tRNA uracil 4-sulfurtransferase ThiI [Bacillus horti]MDQ0168111.1 thiamine biosynthesis protein ThiI [Bacillus horti]
MITNNSKIEFILIRFGELALKGKNRNKFESQLQDNIKNQLKDFKIKIKRTFGRMYVYLENDADYEKVQQRLKTVFGIKSFSPARKAELELEDIRRVALEMLQSLPQKPNTFKVNVRRPNKFFPHNSSEMNHLVGAHLLIHTEDIKVNVHQPEVEVFIEIREDAAYIMCEKIEGAGGLPVGTSGKAMLMLSGGIDSPVAGYLCMKRGIRIEAVHFHSYPFTSERAKQKVVDLTKKLAYFVGHIKLHIVPFTEIQTQIKQHIPDDYSITIMRRFMLRITEQLAEQQKALGLASGENVGQVASQTMHSMRTINEVTNYPIIRPLVTMDKLEIIKIAQDIDTYELSILPYEDCCTIFQPKSPKTRPTIKQSTYLENKLNVEQLIADAVANTEVMIMSEKEEKIMNKQTKQHAQTNQVEKKDIDELF